MEVRTARKKILILGSGFSGLSCAVFADSLGHEVKVLEKKPILGGRTYAFKDKRMGSWVDNGQHLLMGAYHETLSLMENLGVRRHLSIQDKLKTPLFSTQGELHYFGLRDAPYPFNQILGVLGFKALSLADRLRFFKVGLALKKLKGNFNHPSLNQTVTQWLTSLGQSLQSQRNFWDILTLATLNQSPHKAQARLLAVVLTRGLMGSASDSALIIPKATLNDLLALPAKNYLEARGQKIFAGIGAKKIHILDGKVQGIETTSGEMVKADIYVSAMPHRNLLSIMPPGFVESIPYFSQLEKLTCAPIVSINFWFDRPVMEGKFLGAADKNLHWYFNKNEINGDQNAPYHIMGVISGAEAWLESSREEILKMALDEMAQVFPAVRSAKILHSLVNKEREATLSHTVETEPYRPSQQSPFENFYVIGDWTQTGLPATIESAVVSAKLAIGMF